MDLDDADPQTACAVIRFAERRPDRWQPALLPGLDESELRPGQFFGYPVDSGIGCFCDPAEVPQILSMYDQWIDDESAEFPPISYEIERTHTPGWGWANMPLENGLNVVAFTTGPGDGAYSVWFGYHRDAELPVVALNDFLLIRAPGTA